MNIELHAAFARQQQEQIARRSRAHRLAPDGDRERRPRTRTRRFGFDG